MKYTLEELSNLELTLHNSIPKDSHFDDLDEELESKGTFQKYREIHSSYLNLFKSTTHESTKLEALKRLIFLNWYSTIEPSYFTGIGLLDAKRIFDSYSVLDDYIVANNIDSELTWMLKFYASWDFAILNFSKDKLNYLSDFVRKVDKSISTYPRHLLPKGSMNNRGQMGEYWISMEVEIK